LLVFPTLLRATETDRADELPGSVSLYYDFSGAIDNVYASLISWLVIGQGFGRIRLWENRVEFEADGRGACGLRKVSRGGGFAHLDVYFHEGTPTQTQTEFISFVHQHLRSSGIDVVEHFELICANKDCRYEFPRVVVQNRMAKGEADVVCPQCETRIKLSEGFRQERERDEQAERKSFALMTRVREDVPKIVASVKQRAFGRTDEQYRTDRPIRVLHLSDLHFTSDAVPETKLQYLIPSSAEHSPDFSRRSTRHPSQGMRVMISSVSAAVSPGMTKDKSIDEASETHSFPLLWMVIYPSIDYDLLSADI
jgi:uncharacterized Zn-finger protein